MSYCRWSDGDLYAYRTDLDYRVHVAARRAVSGVQKLYVEPSAEALLGRLLWLGSRGCDYPWDALRYLQGDIVSEIEERESDSTRLP